MVNTFDESRMLELGFSVISPTDNSFILSDNGTGNEIVLVRIGDWIQFRCEIFAASTETESSYLPPLLKTFNRLHDLALGARLVISDEGIVHLVSDILMDTVDNEVAALFARNMLYLAELLVDPIESLCASGVEMSNQDIARLF